MNNLIKEVIDNLLKKQQEVTYSNLFIVNSILILTDFKIIQIKS